ncbi:putative nuclease S1 precursor protein [Rutstroemia sp. NJR-2017a BBW]|nr:putative nuclease S1 precursor protein [Rutstroemia sp. NJR-2017a BBW]
MGRKSTIWTWHLQARIVVFSVDDKMGWNPRNCPRSETEKARNGNLCSNKMQLLSPDTTEYDRYIAAKFIVHFVGDIHQPLHDENISQGGNGIRVNFTGTSTNLHHVWDTSIPEKLIGGYSMADAHAWANALTIAIKSGVYASQAESWLQGMDIRDPITTSLAWANEANAFICTTVMPEGAEGVLGKELSGEYYENGVPVVQLQVAKAGYRLAAWLDMIAGDEKEEL